MRIGRPVSSTDRDRQRRVEIERAVASQPIEGRVCGEACAKTCPQCGAGTCQCMCSPQCPDIPRAISSDPDRHPIEPAVAPLVFALKRTAKFQPCWSCEGHLGLDGRIWKLPRVWFYCESMVEIRLLTDGLMSLEQSGVLNTAWRIGVTFSDPDNAETTFSLEPAQPLDESVDLPALQADLSKLAYALPEAMNSQAQNLLRETAGDAKRAG